jgi:spore maturation protein CgeB
VRFVLFYHSFISCWNHGNAHFLRGIARELLSRGHQVAVWEPADGWSRINALQDGGKEVLEQARELMPGVELHCHDRPDLERALDGADIVIAHEWNSPELVAELGRHRIAGGRFSLLFHDTHHRAVTDASAIEAFDLDGYDAVLAFGDVLRQVYVERGWGRSVFTWHEAADTPLFKPLSGREQDVDLLWVGNWGDGERERELGEFLIDPVAELGITARVYGVRYPPGARTWLDESGIEYRGWLPNHHAPEAYAQARMTIHVPRRAYVEMLPGIPTIRVFEALACGIPLVSAPWRDTEGLFPPGSYLEAADAEGMRDAIGALLRDRALAAEIAGTGLDAVRKRHTCAHRVDELFAILRQIASPRLSAREPERVAS